MLFDIRTALLYVMNTLLASMLFSLLLGFAARAVEFLEHPANVAEVFDGLPCVVLRRVTLPLDEVNALAI